MGTTSEGMELGDGEFERIRAIIQNNFGIRLPDHKRPLVQGRLRKLVVESGTGSFAKFCDKVLTNPSRADLSRIVDRITTNHTHFNREKGHFEYLAKVALPEVTNTLRRADKRDLRIWCAASATGEEPYMLGMLQLEQLGASRSHWQAGVLATDISENALTAARRGIYDEAALVPLPEHLRKKYFRAIGGSEGRVQAVEALRQEVTFRRLNLMREHYPFKRRFHVIFCRNVMIYFDRETREQVAKRLFDSLAPGGFLFVGHCETLGARGHGFESVATAAYRRPH